MKITLLDRSLYLKGLMLLIRKDQVIHNEEKALMMHIGRTLGFEEDFCEKAIEEILICKHVVDEPPHFSKPDIARCFIKDGLKVSLIDREANDHEIAWLKSVSRLNGIDERFVDENIYNALGQIHESVQNTLEIRNFEWE